MTNNQMLSLIVMLAVPSILAQITSVLMFYIDAAMVGALGAKASAAIGLVESSTWLIGGLTGAAAMGFSVQAAQSIGASQFHNARQAFAQGLACTIIFSAFITCICVIIARPLPLWLGGGEDIAPQASNYFLIYALALPLYQIGMLSSGMLKSSGNMRVPSIISILTCVFDVTFNFLLIFPTRQISILGHEVTMPGAGMGVEGAAIGTGLAYVVTGGFLIWFAAFRSPLVSVVGQRLTFRPQMDFIKKALKIGGPIGIQNILMSGAQIVSTTIVAPLGNFAIAANTFAITAESLCYMPGYGIGEAATTLVGQSVGAGRKHMTRTFAKMAIIMGMAVMAVMGVVMYIMAPEMISLMTPVEEIRQLGTTSLRIEAWAEPMFAASIVSYSVCVGAGDTFVPACMSLASMWLVRLTLAAMLAPKYGLPGVWAAMAIELTFRGIIFIVRIWSGRWLKKLK